MSINVTDLSTNEIIYTGCAECFLESNDNDLVLESKLNQLESSDRERIKYVNDNDDEFIIEKELELIWDWVLTEWK